MTKSRSPFVIGICALAVGGLGYSPAFAGEVTGNGKEIGALGASICKFSGQNDGEDPPGRTQSFGQNVANDYPTGNPVDPTSFDPDDLFNLHPGWFCNPNNVDATNF